MAEAAKGHVDKEADAQGGESWCVSTITVLLGIDMAPADASPDDTLYLTAEVTCATAPHTRVTCCTSCQAREARPIQFLSGRVNSSARRPNGWPGRLPRESGHLAPMPSRKTRHQSFPAGECMKMARTLSSSTVLRSSTSPRDPLSFLYESHATADTTAKRPGSMFTSRCSIVTVGLSAQG